MNIIISYMIYGVLWNTKMDYIKRRLLLVILKMEIIMFFYVFDVIPRKREQLDIVTQARGLILVISSQTKQERSEN